MRITLVRDRAVGLVACAAGVVLAAQQVTLFRLDEPSGRRALALAIISIVLVAGMWAGMRPVRSLARRGQEWAVRIVDGRTHVDVHDHPVLLVAGPMAVVWTWWVVDLAVSAVLSTALMWVSAWLCRMLGLAVTLPWFWPAAMAALVVEAGRCAVGRVVALLWRSRGAARAVVRYVSVALGLLATVALPTAGFAPGAWIPSLVVLSAAFALIDVWLAFPFLTTLVRVAINGGKLWLLVWASGWWVVPLEIHGSSTYVLGAVFLTVTTTPSWWYDRAHDGQQQPPPPPDAPVRRHRPRGPWTWYRPVVFAGTVAGVQLAATLVPGFTSGGPVVGQLAAASLIAAVHKAAGAGVSRGLRRVLARPGHVPVAVSLAVSPLVVWLTVRGGAALGLPVYLEGLAAAVVTSLLIAVAELTSMLLYGAVVVGLDPRCRRRTGGLLVDYAATVAGLWIATVALDGVRLEPGSVAARLVAAIVLSALFMPATSPFRLAVAAFELTESWGAVAAAAALNLAGAALVLWALSWLSTATPVTLSISGFWAFVLTVLLMAALKWARVVREVARDG